MKLFDLFNKKKIYIKEVKHEEVLLPAYKHIFNETDFKKYNIENWTKVTSDLKHYKKLKEFSEWPLCDVIRPWNDENLLGHWYACDSDMGGHDYYFEKGRDASLFILKWF